MARAGLIVLSEHAQHRMHQRRVLFSDVRCALRNAKTVNRSSADQVSEWTATGPDTVGEELTLGVILRGGIIVITVY